MSTVINSLNNTIGASNSGVTNTLTITNPSDTASSSAQELLTVGGTSAGDPWIQWSIGSTRSYALGIDNSNSDVWNLTTAAGATVDPSSGSTLMQVQSDGHYSFNSLNANSSQYDFPGDINGILEIHLRNANTGANATAGLVLRVADAGTSDPNIKFIEDDTGSTWNIGMDNDDSDAFVLSRNNGLGTNNVMRSSTAGEVTFPLTSAFLATHTVAQTNVTGNGTAVTVNFTTEVFDQNGDYDGTNTFIAPVTGRYVFAAEANVSDMAGGTHGQGQFTTSNRIYFGGVYPVINNDFFTGFCAVVAVDMDANDTCKFEVTGYGVGADNGDISADATQTYFSGRLAC